MFQKQVLLQCKFLLAAASQVNHALKTRNIEYTFYGIQNALNSAANISKALWGSGARMADQRKKLRDSIGVTDDSPLKDVAMRNNFEHFDERLDRWWADSEKHNSADLILGPPEQIVGFADNEQFRYFNPITNDVVFWGEKFNLQRLVDEVEKIRPKLEEEAKKPHWNPAPPTVPG